MKNETIKKINMIAPYIIVMLIVLVFKLSVLPAICVGILVGTISAIINAYYKTKD